MAARHSTSDPITPVMILVNRLALGFYFAYAGIGKFQLGLENFYNDKFVGMAPHWVPGFILRPYGYALPFAEVLFGVLLMLGLFGRTAATFVMMMLLSIIIAQMNAGGFFHGDKVPGPYHANLIFLTLSFWLITTGPSAISLDAIWFKSNKRR
jgi:uncharacterized membrane protein YphA (DoxX/SURF4 family)